MLDHNPSGSSSGSAAAVSASLCFAAIGTELDAIRNRVRADLGQRDADYIHTMVKRQRQFEVAGRVMMMIPPTWPLGVASLGVSKILDNMEIGHNVMHGQYDWMGEAALNSKNFEFRLN